MLNCRSFHHRYIRNYLKSGLFLLCYVYFIINTVNWNSYSPASKPRRIAPNQNKALQRSDSRNQTAIYKKRVLVRLENTDEFLLEVLGTVEIKEVDLNPIAEQSVSEFDAEIRRDVEKADSSLEGVGGSAVLNENLDASTDEIYKTDGFNRLLSDYISYDRRVPDLRDPGCVTDYYDDLLPTTTVVIVFTDETFSTLIRTVTSVINRTPTHLLSDIILVDDFSTREHLKGKLERYLATHFPLDKIRLVRLSRPAGLIKAKMLGAHLATGDTITFIDAHCEVLEHWIEPLLQRIKDDRTVIPCPQMDFIGPDTMEIYSMLLYPAFLWNGVFHWTRVPQEELNRRPAKHSPIRTPVMVGGIFAVDRKYFWEIGSYDPRMEKWGGENLEMAFRVWQCGGSIEEIPCSHVAHVAKKFAPYRGKMDEWVMNTARAAKVWMDEYQDIFFSFWPTMKSETIDVASRRRFRERKQCKSFQWYLDNVYPSKFQLQHQSKFHGQVRNEESGYCLDADSDTRFDVEYSLTIRPCLHHLPVQQIFFISNDDKLRREYECAVEREDRIEMIPCDNTESHSSTWEYNNLQLVHIPSNLCVTVMEAANGILNLRLENCDLGNTAQRWVFNG